MKKLLFLLAFTIGFISCNDEKHVWSFEDMSRPEKGLQ